MATEVVLLVKSALAPLQERIAKLEAAPPLAAEIAPEDIAASIAGLLRKELADLDVTDVRMQKRVIRDAQGQIVRVVEEPVSS